MLKSGIVLNNELFWNWVSGLFTTNTGDRINNYLKCISSLEIDQTYLIENIQKGSTNSNYSLILRKLKDCIPPYYFLEIQYSILAYSTIFSKIFPPLVKHIEQLAYIEWLLCVEPEKTNYRDHLVHMFKVAFVCDSFIYNNDGFLKQLISYQFESNHFNKWLKDRNLYINKGNKCNILKIATFIAALFHDFGHGHRFINNYRKKLFNLGLPGFESIDVSENTLKLLTNSLLIRFIVRHHKSIRTTRLSNPSKNIKVRNAALGFIRDCISMNHSISSSIVVLNIAEYLLRSRVIGNDIYIAFQIAAEACMLHDMTEDSKYLHFDNHYFNPDNHRESPVSAILILADELSIWNRYKIDYKPTGKPKELKIVLSNKWKAEDYPNRINIDFDNKKRTLKILLDNSSNDFNSLLSELETFKKNSTDESLHIFDYTININKLFKKNN
jgi:hypothetical protein